MSSMSVIVRVTLLLLLCNVAVIASSDVNQTTEQEIPSLSSLTTEEETRRVRRLEAEVEILRRSVTELKASGPCATQQMYTSLEADALSVAQEVRGLRHHVQSLRMYSELSAIRSELRSLRSKMPSDVTEEVKLLTAVPVADERPEDVTRSSTPPGSVYTRWGNSQCPSDAHLVYSGVIGGSHLTHEGAASNTLCLPLNPVFEDYVLPGAVTYLFGAEYEVTPLPSHDLEPKCSLCHIARAATVMVPATNSCHPGWTMEYSGILMAGHHTQKAATEFVCMDAALEGMIGTKDTRDGKVFYFTVAQCGSLPCPPYVNAKVLSCVVCSK